MAISRLKQTSLQNAFQKYTKIWDGVSATGAMDAISFVNLGADSTLVEFNNIPQTYTHLQLRVHARSQRATVSFTDLVVQINGVTTASAHRTHYLNGNGATASSSTLSDTVSYFGRIGAQGTASLFGGGILDILDYTNTNKLKTMRWLGGTDANGSGEVYLSSGMMVSNNNAITSIILQSYSGSGFTGFSTYSSFALYGIK